MVSSLGMMGLPVLRGGERGGGRGLGGARGRGGGRGLGGGRGRGGGRGGEGGRRVWPRAVWRCATASKSANVHRSCRREGMQLRLLRRCRVHVERRSASVAAAGVAAPLAAAAAALAGCWEVLLHNPRAVGRAVARVSPKCCCESECIMSCVSVVCVAPSRRRD